MKKVITLWIISFSFFSCENFLDVNPKSEILGDKLFQTAEGFEDALYGVYTVLGKQALYGEKMSYYLPDLLASYYIKEESSKQDEYLLTFQYTSSYFNGRSQFDEIWKIMYQNISYTNNIIRNLEGRGNDFRYASFYEGEALALRAFMHFDLCNAFAPAYRDDTKDYPAIPYIENYQALVYPFNTMEQVYQKIIRDLKKAESLMANEGLYLNLPRKDLPGISKFMTSRQFHLNLYAIQALLARVYQMKNDQDSAMIYADKVIHSEKFQFTNKTDIEYDVASCISDNETIWAVQPFSEWESKMQEYFDYSDDNTEHALMPLNGFYLYPKYGYPEGMYTMNWGFRTLYDVSSIRGQQDYRINWFRQREGVNGQHARFYKIYRNKGQRKSSRGINMIRIPEMYLIMAEGLLKQGQPEKAKEYFDFYTSARGFTYGNETSFDMNLINKEYRKEFIGEGRTWFNMKRQNLNLESCYYYGYSYAGSDQIYVWPIPDNEFEYREGGKEGVYPSENENVQSN